MVFSAHTSFNILFVQIVNQSYNSLVNFTYMTPSADISIAFMLMSYLGAVGTSCVVGLGTNRWYKNNEHRFKEPIKSALRISIPYVAVASANMFNLVISKSYEIQKGLPIQAENG